MQSSQDTRQGRPTREHLEKYASWLIWDIAIKTAMKSPHQRHRTGCVLYYGMGNQRNPKIYAKGYAQPHLGGLKVRSVHAEMDAIKKLGTYKHRRNSVAGGAVAIVVTLTKGGNFASVSKPCQTCAELLKSHVWGIIYAERANDGSWLIRSDAPEDLTELQRTRYWQ